MAYSDTYFVISKIMNSFHRTPREYYVANSLTVAAPGIVQGRRTRKTLNSRLDSPHYERHWNGRGT